MSKQKKSRIGYKILSGLLIGLCVVSLGSVIGLYSNTLIKIWIPIAGAAFIAVASGFFMWRIWKGLTGSNKKWINRSCHIAVVTAILPGIFYTLNFVFSDHASLEYKTVKVARKFYKTRHKTKRISRRVYGQGEAYKQYYMEVSFPSGQKTELSVPFKQYRQLKVGMELSLPVETGLFHIPVIKRRGKVIDVPESHYRP